MGNPKGFLNHTRELPKYRPVEERVQDYNDLYQPFSDEKTATQASRCMDCGVPFCHSGCPLGNIIPEFNDAVYNEDWEYAFEILSSTNNFPEFTGRICPAPCEKACVLGINQPPVAIEHIEKSIAEKAYELGYAKANPPIERSGKTVAVVGSGPAGLAAAAQLNKVGHLVTVCERADRIGGLLRYGIPDFKLEKWTIDRKIALMEEEGIVFKTNANIGVNMPVTDLTDNFDAVVLCGGSTVPRDLPIKGRHFKGVHFAMDFLTQSNKRVAGDEIAKEAEIMATDKNVLVIGGGDTGSDCVGTSNRHKAKSVTQIELLVKPPNERAESTPWPLWPMELRTSSSHEEGADRDWSVGTKELIGENGKVTGLKAVRLEWEGRNMKEVPGSEFTIKADLVFLAMGFVSPLQKVLDAFGVEKDGRGNAQATTDGEGCYKTSKDKVFAAGDMRRGQSLVVWAIREGRQCAKAVDEYLMGSSVLPR